MLSLALSVSLNPFDHDRDAVADADAQADYRVTAAAAVELAGGGERNACAGRAERVTEGNGAAVRIDARIVVGEAEQLQAAKHLGAKASLISMTSMPASASPARSRAFGMV